MGTPTTKNLGLVKAIHVGNNPPINTQMLWYNTNPMVNQHYYYDVITTSWVSLTSGSIAAINVSYDNTTSALTATNVQAAIDELDAILDSLSLTAANVTYDNSGSGLTAINVQNAIDEVLGLIPTVSYPVTTAQNGLSLNGTIVELGTNTAVFTASITGTTMTVTGVPVGTIAVGQLIISGGNSTAHIAANTIITALGTGSGGTGTYTVSISQTITSSTFTSVVPLTKPTTVSGSVSNPLKIAGEIQLKPVSATTTSQNKTVQLANITGALSLVNKGIYARRSGVLRTPHILTLPIPNGGLPMTATYTFGVTVAAGILSINTSFGTTALIGSGWFVLNNQVVTGVGVPANTYIVSNTGSSNGNIFTINNPIADGNYTFSIDKNTEILPTVNAGTIEFTGNANGIQTSRINASNADDSTLTEISPYFVLGIGTVANRVVVRMTINPADDIVVCPHVSFRDYGITVTDCTNATNGGGPVIDVLSGYKQSKFCPAGVDSIIELYYIDNTSTQALWRNPCIYRNVIGGGAASDLVAVACTVKGWEIEKYQL